MKNLLYFSMAIIYLADYSTLIGLMELARQLYTQKEIVSIYILFGLPPILMLLFSKRLAQNQSNPLIRASILAILGSITISSLQFSSKTYLIFIVALILGFNREMSRVLINRFIKYNFSKENSEKILNSIITIRYILMIAGMILSGSLGEKGQFHLLFNINALLFFISSLLLYRISKCGTEEKGALKNSAQDATKAKLNSETSSRKLIHGIHGISEILGLHQYIWLVLSTIGIGCFMALEYALLTTELNVPPRMVGLLYIAHIAGSLFAGLSNQKIKTYIPLNKAIVLSSAGQIVSFGLIGALGNSFITLSIQIAFSSFYMVWLEIISNQYFFDQCPKSDFDINNIKFRTTISLSEFFGSLPPMFFATYISLKNLNFTIHLVLLISCLVILFIIKFSNKAFKSFRKLLIILSLLPTTALLSGCKINSSPTDTDIINLHKEISVKIESDIASIIPKAQDLLRNLNANFKSQKEPCDFKLMPESSHDGLSFYKPTSTRSSNRLNCFFLAAKPLHVLFEELYKATDFISWIYIYDSASKGFVIYPPTNTKILFGDNLTFNSFVFYKSSVTNFPNGSFNEIKADINGTGNILIYSQGIDLQHTKNITSLGIDIKVAKVFHKNYMHFLDFTKSHELNDFIFIAYSYTSKNKFKLIDYFQANPQMSQGFRPQPEIEISEKLKNSTDYFERTLIQHRQQFQNKIATENLLRLEEFKIGNNKYFCVSSLTKPVDISLFSCMKD